MNKFIGFITLSEAGLYFWSKNPQITPLVLSVLSVLRVILVILIFLALACGDFQMLRLMDADGSCCATKRNCTITCRPP